MPHPARARIRRLSVLALVAAAAATACGDTAQEQRQPSAVGVVPGLERFYEQDVDWESCGPYDADGPMMVRQGVECARIEVPLDYEDPDGEVITLAVSRLPAGGDRIGSLLVNPGGPGASGLSTALAADGTVLADRFDVVGFDPRGVGSSEPAVRCLTDAEFDADRAVDDGDTSPEGIAATEKRNREYAQLCVERNGTDLLAHVGTREVVQDMDVLRGVLGDDALTYLGYSYGTRLGTLYAEAFPGRVRAMVLDGAIDPEQDPVEEIVLQAVGFQKAFDEFAAYCAQYAGCPLGADPARAAERFRGLVDPLLDAPAPTTDPRGLSHRDAITGVQQGLYSPTLWGSLRGGLEALATTGTGDTLLRLADLYEGRGEDGTYSNITDAFNAIRCVDDPPVTDRALAGELDTRFRAAAPFLDDGRGTGSAALDVCAFWPVPATGEPHTPDVRDLPPALVVSTTGDPATPYDAGVELAARLGGVLVTFEGTQHTVALDGNECVDTAVTSYLVDLEVPARDPRC
ncbi:alpha/beta hydrolase [Rhodococcus pyridinivorans]|uniref:alpha/beta hydrolase n=1 Tax=Rhodococcus pyridinivorans TaxID=103816 RepID=UPI0002E930E6|nr:alpha/beta hydrolase [Rhodococcus pyridinivorans]MCD2139273.1 alpha/beta hydrolase [Rhodococcus pyridinivorans]